MSPREIAACALGIETSAITSVEPIKHGLTNESWLVRTETDAVVVRVSSQHGEALQIDRVAESIVLDAVAAAGIGPPVVVFDVHRSILVTRYLGPTCEPAKLHLPDYIHRIGRLLRRLHDVPSVRGVREVHLPTVIAGYLETLQTLREAPAQPDDVSARALELASWIAASSSPCLCHNDVHHLNIVDGERLHLIDWEYAGLGEPFFDLASVCVYHEYSPAEREALLGAYLGRRPPQLALDRLGKCCWLFELVRELWTRVRSAVDTN